MQTLWMTNFAFLLGLWVLGGYSLAHGGCRLRPRIGSIFLLVILVAVYGLEWTGGAVGDEARLLEFGALPVNGMLHGEYWRFLTFGFLQLNPFHILLNASLLFWVGPIFEIRAGTRRFCLVFLCSSVASGIGIHLWHLHAPSHGAAIGASGGNFGLLGAALVLTLRLPGERPRLRIWLAVVLGAGLLQSFLPSVSMAGHLVGMLAGMALALVLPAHPISSN